MAVKIKIKHFKYIYRSLLFVLTVAFILYLFPREGKFRFEFQKGHTWQHNMLYAPFNFPVNKSIGILNAEKDSLLKQHYLFFKINEQASADVLDHILSRMDIEWEKALYKDSHYDSYKNMLSTIFNDVYSMGVISYSELNRLKIEGKSNIVILDEGLARNSLLSEVQTTKIAYENIINKASEVDSLANFETLVTALDLNQYLAFNLEFDKALTERAKEELLSQISLTSGLVQAGDRIVDKGQYIDDEVFQVLESFKDAYEIRLGSSEKRQVILAGQAIIISVLLITFYTFLYFYRIDIFENNRDFSFIIINILLFLLLTAGIKHFTDLSVYIIPFAILPVILRTFFDSRTAIFANIITILIASFFAGNSFEFILLQITVGMAAAFSLKELNKRGQLFRASIFVFLSYCLIYFGLGLVQEGSFANIEYKFYLYFVINGLLMLFAYPLIYIYEKVFGYLSDVTLMELSDTNHPLLRRLSEKAPGTFQHSIMVSNLAQDAALSIGASPLLARVGALYHDIGKSVQSIYFTENQSGRISPHNSLKPEESARIVIDHVKEGVKLANKYGLPKMITDFIETHHGLGKTKFFMIQDQKSHPDTKVDESLYAYPGPNPFTKETAIMMMADSVEAASRSLEEYTDATINGLVESVIETQLSEGYFRHAPITFLEIEKVKEIFKDKLKNIYHTRIAYPKEALNPTETKNDPKSDNKV